METELFQERSQWKTLTWSPWELRFNQMRPVLECLYTSQISGKAKFGILFYFQVKDEKVFIFQTLLSIKMWPLLAHKEKVNQRRTPRTGE